MTKKKNPLLNAKEAMDALAEHQIPILTKDEVKKLLEEGRECRKEFEKRFSKTSALSLEDLSYQLKLLEQRFSTIEKKIEKMNTLIHNLYGDDK